MLSVAAIPPKGYWICFLQRKRARFTITSSPPRFIAVRWTRVNKVFSTPPYIDHKPTDWESLGVSYHYNAGGLVFLVGGGFKEEPEDQTDGLGGKSENWAPSPSLYILLYEPPARLYQTDECVPMWYQWHFLRGPSDIEDPQTARQEFISPIAFVDGHVAQHNFSKSLSTDPYFPYEPTKDWIWYKPAAKEVAQR